MMVRNLPGLWLKMVRQPKIERDEHQRQRGDAGDGERRPQQQVAPLVLQQLEPVGDAREVARFDVGREVRPLVGEEAGVEHVAVGDVVPAAVDEVVPGQLAHDRRRHRRRRLLRGRGGDRRGASRRRPPAVCLPASTRPWDRTASRLRRRSGAGSPPAPWRSATRRIRSRDSRSRRTTSPACARAAWRSPRRRSRRACRARSRSRDSSTRRRSDWRCRRRRPRARPPPWWCRASAPTSAAPPCSTA